MSIPDAAQDGNRRRRGRPRSKAARAAILDATLALLHEHGYSRLAIEAVAERSRTGKATIYRWWPNKVSLVADAYLDDAVPSFPFPDTGSIREDFRRQMQLLAQFLAGPKGQLLATLLGQGHDEPDLSEVLRARVLNAWRGEAAEVLRRGVRDGQLRREVYSEVALDLLYGPIFDRFLSGRGGLTPDYIDALCDAVMTGLAPARTL